MLKSEKSNLVASLKEEFSNSNTMIIAHYHGLSVAQISKLRRAVRGAGAKFTVAKNTLLKLAMKDTTYEQASDMLKGPTAVAVSSDPVAISKVLTEFANANESLKILGGVANDNVLTLEGVKLMATLPSLDELRGKIISIIQTPAISIARLLGTPATDVTRVISAHATKNN